MNIEEKKYSRVASVAFWFAVMWACSSSIQSMEYTEFSDIVSAFKKFEKESECNLAIDIERRFLSWAPGAIEVKMTESDITIDMQAHYFWPPDRFKRNSGGYLYRYNAEETRNGLLVSKYLQFHINELDQLTWIEMGECKGMTQEEKYWEFGSSYGLVRCTNPVIEMRCESQ